MRICYMASVRVLGLGFGEVRVLRFQGFAHVPMQKKSLGRCVGCTVCRVPGPGVWGFGTCLFYYFYFFFLGGGAGAASK